MVFYTRHPLAEKIFGAPKPASKPTYFPEFSSGVVDPPSPKSTYFPEFEEAPPVPSEPAGVRGLLGEGSSGFRRGYVDPALGMAAGMIGAGEGVVGIADIIANLATLGKSGGAIGNFLEEKFGYDPETAQAAIREYYSPELKSNLKTNAETKGFLPSAAAYLKSPSTIIQAAAESAPSMIGGGGIKDLALKGAPRLMARIAPKSAPLLAAAIGEGAFSSGSGAEQTRQATGGLTPKQTALHIAAGAGTGLINRLSGGIADKLGIADPDTLSMGSSRGLLSRLSGGAVTEGSEELLQSGQEQGLQNVALDRPWAEGVPEAAASGALTGAAMGAGFNIPGPLRGTAAPQVKDPTDPSGPEDPISDDPVEILKALARGGARPVPTTLQSAPAAPIAPVLPRRQPSVNSALAQLVLDADQRGVSAQKALEAAGISPKDAAAELKRLRQNFPEVPKARGVDAREDKKAQDLAAEQEREDFQTAAASFDQDPLARRRAATPQETDAYLAESQAAVEAADAERRAAEESDARSLAPRVAAQRNLEEQAFRPLLDRVHAAKTEAEMNFDDQTMAPKLSEAERLRADRERVAQAGGPAFRLHPLLAKAVEANSIKPLVDAGVPGSHSQLRKMLEKAKASVGSDEGVAVSEQVPAATGPGIGTASPVGQLGEVGQETRSVAERVNPVLRAEQVLPAGETEAVVGSGRSDVVPPQVRGRVPDGGEGGDVQGESVSDSAVADYRARIDQRIREIKRKEPNLPHRIIAQRMNQEFGTDNRLGKGREALGRRIVDEVLKGQENPKTTDRGNYPGGPVSAMVNSQKDTGPENDPERNLYQPDDPFAAAREANQPEVDAGFTRAEAWLRQKFGVPETLPEPQNDPRFGNAEPKQVTEAELENAVLDARGKRVQGQPAVAPTDKATRSEGLQTALGADRGNANEAETIEQPNTLEAGRPLVANEAPKAVEAHSESVPQRLKVQARNLQPGDVARGSGETILAVAKQFVAKDETQRGKVEVRLRSSKGKVRTAYWNPSTEILVDRGAPQAQATSTAIAKSPALYVQIGDRRFEVKDFEDASKRWEGFRDAAFDKGATGATLPRPIIVDQDGKQVARIAQNGRIFPPAATFRDEIGQTPLYDNRTPATPEKPQKTATVPVERPKSAEVEETAAKPQTPIVAAEKVTDQIERVVDTQGVKSAKDVHERVVAALQEELEAAKKISPFKEIVYRADGTSGGKPKAWIGVDGRGFAILDFYGLHQIDPKKDIEIDLPKERTHATVTPMAKLAIARQLTPKAGSIRIQIPGDGTFTIPRNIVAIQMTLDKIQRGGAAIWKSVVGYKPGPPREAPKATADREAPKSHSGLVTAIYRAAQNVYDDAAKKMLPVDRDALDRAVKAAAVEGVKVDYRGATGRDSAEQWTIRGDDGKGYLLSVDPKGLSTWHELGQKPKEAVTAPAPPTMSEHLATVDAEAEETRKRRDAARPAPAEPVASKYSDFTAVMTPMAAGKAVAALEKAINTVERGIDKRGPLVEKMVADGFKVTSHQVDDPTTRRKLEAEWEQIKGRYPIGNPSHPETIRANEVRDRLKGNVRKTQRRLGSDQYFWTEEDLGKTAMDYAEFLIARRDGPAQAAAEEKGNLGERADLIEKIVAAAAAGRPKLTIHEVFEVKGTDGKWYGTGGMPFGVRMVEPTEKRSKGFGTRNEQGIGVGVIKPTLEAQEQRVREMRESNDSEFRKALEEMTDERLKSQAEYWLKDKAPAATKSAPKPKPVEPKPEPTKHEMIVELLGPKPSDYSAQMRHADQKRAYEAMPLIDVKAALEKKRQDKAGWERNARIEALKAQKKESGALTPDEMEELTGLQDDVYDARLGADLDARTSRLEKIKREIKLSDEKIALAKENLDKAKEVQSNAKGKRDKEKIQKRIDVLDKAYDDARRSGWELRDERLKIEGDAAQKIIAGKRFDQVDEKALTPVVREAVEANPRAKDFTKTQLEAAIKSFASNEWTPFYGAVIDKGLEKAVDNSLDVKLGEIVQAKALDEIRQMEGLDERTGYGQLDRFKYREEVKRAYRADEIEKILERAREDNKKGLAKKSEDDRVAAQQAELERKRIESLKDPVPASQVEIIKKLTSGEYNALKEGVSPQSPFRMAAEYPSEQVLKRLGARGLVERQMDPLTKTEEYVGTLTKAGQDLAKAVQRYDQRLKNGIPFAERDATKGRFADAFDAGDKLIVGKANGKDIHSSGRWLVEGAKPAQAEKYDATEFPSASLEKTMVPRKKAETIRPVAYFENDRGEYIVMSNGSVFNARYFDYVASVQPGSTFEAHAGEKETAAYFKKGGRYVGVVMPIRYDLPPGAQAIVDGKTAEQESSLPVDEAKPAEAPKPKGEAKASAALSDVGEKIGGSRKDRWAARGLMAEDLQGMSGGEQAQYVTKDNVWPKIDYAARIAAGMEPRAAALLKLIRDRVATAPSVRNKQTNQEARAAYVEVVGTLRDLAAKANSFAEVQSLVDDVSSALGITTRRGREAFKVMSEADRAEQMKRYEKLWQLYGNKSENPLVAKFSMMRKADAMVKEGWPKKAERAATTKDGETKKIEPSRPHLDAIERTGEDVRQGRDITPEEFRNHFGFRGVEFGNWAANDERQKLVNLAFEALHDLANVMGIPPKAISMNGTLGLALAARGGGKFAAHYEPGKLVINMTKINGAGSLAHEWGHALDHYFGEQNRPDAYQGAARGVSGWYSKSTAKLGHLRAEVKAAFERVMDTLFKKFQTKAEIIRDKELLLEKAQARLDEVSKMEPTDAMSKRSKEIGMVHWDRQVQSIRKDLERTRAEMAENSRVATGRSDYEKEADKLSGNSAKGYWLRPTEMFARAFESFVFDRIRSDSRVSDYLVHGVEADRYSDSKKYKGNPYPTGTEREDIDAAFQNLVDTLQTKETDKGVAMFATAPNAKPSKPITLQIVKNAIPGLPWKQNEDGSFTAKMADGRTLRLQPNANMLDIVEGNRGAFEESARAGGNVDAVPVGAYSPFGISAEALISIAEASPGGTIEHEGLHFLWDVALHPKEKAALVKKFGGEEESAYAFAKWLTERNRKPVGVFQKVRDFVRRLVHYFRPTWESTFGEAASGRAARRVAGESTGGERFAAAWHGSPHKFDRFKFDASTVGTGEGAQAYGHGLYFAEDKGVGTNYQNQLRPPTEIDTISMGGVPLYKDGVPVDYGVRGAHTLDKEATATLQEDLLINEQEIKQAFEEMGERGVAERFKEAIEDRIATAKDEYPEIVPAYERILKRFETEQKTAKLKRGEAHLYEVDIPDSVVDRMLDWDKPLSQQPESVLKALERGGVIDSHGTLILDNDIASRYIATGERVYRKIAAKNDVVSKNDIAIDPRGEANASKFLSSLGIPGIKYLDGSSRSKGEGSRNFVVFDDKDVTILTRNGEKVGGSEKAEAIQDLQSQHPETAGSAKFATAPKEEPKESFNGIRGMDSIRKPEREIKKRLGPVLKALPGAEADLLTGLYDRFTADGDAQTTWEAIDKDALATLGVYTKARFLKLKEKGIDIDVPGFRAAVRMVGEAQATNNSTRRTLEAAGPVDPRSREYRAHVASSAKLAGWIMALNGDQTGAAQAFAVAESALSAKDNAAAALETAFGEIGGLGKDEAARLVQMAKTDPQHLATVMEAAFKPGFSEKMNEWRKGAMLFSLRTYGVNFFGNAMKQAVSIAEIPVAAATDKMTNKGERQVYLGEMAAARAGLADFGREAFRDFLTESWAGLRGVETFDKDGHRPYEQRTPAISGPVGKFIRTPFRMLQAADNFFKETAKAQSLYREAYRRGRTQGLTGDALWKKVDDLISIGKESEWTDPRVSGMMAKATKDAQYETFTLQANYDNAGAFGALADFLGKFEKKVPILGPVAGLALPFKNTPANIAWQSFERSPFGFKVARNQALALRSLYKDLAAAPVEEKADIQAKIDAKQRDLSNQVSRATLGTVLFALGTALAAAGLLTGSGPPDWEKKRVWEEEGNLANAINLGGTWYGYDRFEPIAAALSIAGNTPTVASAEGFEDKAAAFAAAMKDAWISKTYFQGLEDFADLVKDPQRYGASFLRDIEGSFVPAFMGQTVEDFDPIVRDRKANALAPITSKIPGLSQNLPPVHTGRGDFAKRVERAGQGLVPAALNPFGGIRAKSATGDPLAAEMTKAGYASRAHANYLEIGVGPTGAKRKERIDLTEPEREMFRKADQSVSERMRQSIESAGWKNLTPDQKLASFRRNYDRASNSVRDSILPAVHSRLREKLAERKRAN